MMPQAVTPKFLIPHVTVRLRRGELHLTFTVGFSAIDDNALGLDELIVKSSEQTLFREELVDVKVEGKVLFSLTIMSEVK